MIRLGVIGMGHRATGVVALMRRLDPTVALAVVADPAAAQVRERCAKAEVPHESTVFVDGVDRLLNEASRLDAIVVGTRCDRHAAVAAACAASGLPLFLEKPVAITQEQIAALAAAFAGRGDRVVVSFPLRFTPMFGRVAEVVRSDRLGTINQAQAFNFVPYGGIYFGQWYRSFEETGGLWLQKATHDFDYLTHLIGSAPESVAAMGTRRVYGGDRPADLRCSACPDAAECPEGPAAIARRGDDGGMGAGDHACAFSDSIRHHDAGSAIVRYENGVHAAYAQNFVSRRAAAARGARVTGYLATLYFDWYQQSYAVFDHHTGAVERVEVPVPQGHFGGDTSLVQHFLDVVRGAEASRAPLADGLLSAALCAAAQRSETNATFEPVVRYR